MDRVGAVGSSVVIKGELSAQEDVVIAGRVEGTISVEGHLVVVEPGGHVAADVVAKGVVVAGTITGSVVAEERIELRSTARVQGELAAPRISIADGATLSGKVETSKRQAPKLRAVVLTSTVDSRQSTSQSSVGSRQELARPTVGCRSRLH